MRVACSSGYWVKMDCFIATVSLKVTCFSAGASAAPRRLLKPSTCIFDCSLCRRCAQNSAGERVPLLTTSEL